jgi:putative transcriptional regulator
MNKHKSFQHQFLIAMPNLVDINFFHSVVYLCLHTDEGAMGLMINRPLLDIDLGQVMEQMDILVVDDKINHLPVLLGGPVQPERGFVLHTHEKSWESTMPTGKNLAITSSQDILQAIANGAGPQQYLVFLGYSGWGAGEIENELMNNDWLISPAMSDIIFELPFDQRWKSAVKILGIETSQISRDVGHG